MGFLPLLKGSTVPGIGAGVARGSSLGARCFWGHGAKHQIPFRNPSAVGTFSLFLLPTESFPKPSLGSKNSLPQKMKPWLRDTPLLKPKSQSPFAGGIYRAMGGIARAPAHRGRHQPQPRRSTPGTCYSRCASHQRFRQQQWDGIEPRRSQLSARHAASDPRCSPRAALTCLRKYVPHWPHK